MKVILTARDILPLIQALIEKRYPESAGKVRVQFMMRRKAMFSGEAELQIECDLEERPEPDPRS